MGFEQISGPNWVAPTPPAGDNSNNVATTAFVAQNKTATGFVGLTLSSAGDSLTVAAGSVTDSTGITTLTLPSDLAKTNAGTWVAGNNRPGLDAGVIAASTWYYIFIIGQPGGANTDVLISLSLSSPTLPAGYTLFRRLGAMFTDGLTNWTSFFQMGNWFFWAARALDASAVATANDGSRHLITVSVPTGISVLHRFIGRVAGASSSGALIWTSPSENDTAASAGNSSMSWFASTSTNAQGQFDILTNTSAQIGERCNTSGATYYVDTIGWQDFL